MTDAVDLSIVTPVYNEARIVGELVRRCVVAAGHATPSFEVVIVDDASTDGTADRVAALGLGSEVRVLRLPRNRGQFRATQHGIRAARGNLVALLDGDLQHPPEVIPALVSLLLASPASIDVACAVKSSRDDPSWLRAGAATFHLLQEVFGGGRIPPGAGSFCVARRSLAARVASLPVARANLSAALVACGAVGVALPYEKAARYDGRSRVGFAGLAAEAFGSLVLTGALQRMMLAIVGIGGCMAILRAARRRRRTHR